MKAFTLVFLLAVCQAGLSYNSKLHLALYYESKCPDSVKLILNQLKPAMEVLSDYVVLTFVPFGKAHSIRNGNGGFKCQHGPSECRGNIVQDCSLSIMHRKRASDLQKLSYVACEMRTYAAPNGDYSCVDSNEYLTEREVRKCADSNEGIHLQLKSEYATNQVRPKFVPTITINNIFDQQSQDRAQWDLKGVLCSHLGDVPPCAQYDDHQTLRYVYVN